MGNEKIAAALAEIKEIGADIMRELDVALPTFIRILCVDDAGTDCELLERTLRKPSKVVYKVEACATYAEAVVAINERRHDAYLIDYKLDCGHTALDLLKEVEETAGPFIIWSGYVNESVTEQILNSGARNFISKNESSYAVLNTAIRFMIKNWRLHNKVMKLASAFSRLSDIPSEPSPVLASS